MLRQRARARARARSLLPCRLALILPVKGLTRRAIVAVDSLLPRQHARLPVALGHWLAAVGGLRTAGSVKKKEWGGVGR